MVQFARPTSDLNVGGFVNELAASVNLFQSIDEVTPNDADYVQSPTPAAGTAYVAGIGGGTDPGVSTGHVFSYRYQKDPAVSAQINLTAELRQGYVSEASQGLLIATRSHTNIGGTVAQADQTLTAPEADAITDYSALSMRFIFQQV